MAIHELADALLRATLVSSIAVVIVALARRPVRQWSGARAAYVLWALLPCMLLAALLPAPDVAMAPRLGVVMGIDAARHGAQAATRAFDLRTWGIGVWVVGVFVFAGRQWLRQRAFVQGLGRLSRREDGLWQAQSTAGLPAIVGLRSRLVLPADFDARFAIEERALILAHEKVHVARGDVVANVVALAVRCAFWFNPLVWWAAARYRRDQELACDAVVAARHPHARRLYGEAMLKAQLSFTPIPLGCQWSGIHPLKERIAMLKHPVPSTRRVRSGLLCVGLLVACGVCTAWATQQSGTAGSIAAAPVPAAISAQAPHYPQAAVTNNQSGRVMLLVDVAADGSVAQVRVEHSEPAGVFDAATIAAASQWKFTPAHKNGKPVASRVRVPVDFDTGMHATAAPAGRKDGGDYDWYTVDPTAVKVDELQCDVVEGRADGKEKFVCGKRRMVGRQ